MINNDKLYEAHESLLKLKLSGTQSRVDLILKG